MVATVPRAVDGGGRFVEPRADFVPAYIEAYLDGRLQEKIGRTPERAARCHLERAAALSA